MNYVSLTDLGVKKIVSTKGSCAAIDDVPKTVEKVICNQRLNIPLDAKNCNTYRFENPKIVGFFNFMGFD
jgi:hypothetical protein